MADNTRMKEIVAGLRRQAKMLEKSDAVANKRFDRLEAMQKTSNTRVNQLVEAIEKLMQQLPHINVSQGSMSSSTMNAATAVTQGSALSILLGSSSSTSTTSPPFQVRHIKLEFPRFNGKNVLD